MFPRQWAPIPHFARICFAFKVEGCAVFAPGLFSASVLTMSGPLIIVSRSF